MEIKYICTRWGSEDLPLNDFIQKAKKEGYDGVELHYGPDEDLKKELAESLYKNNMLLIAQQWMPPANESVSAYRERMLKYIRNLASLNPEMINSHTGKDFFSFEDNCLILNDCEKLTVETGITIVHETHRGRFNFHAASTIPYLTQFPNLKLNADFSHWTNVSESLLEDQEQIIEQIIPHCYYMHTRVGSDQSAQVNHPFAPEWEQQLERFSTFWQRIITHAQQRGDKVFYICPEFGPFPYIQQLPFTKAETVNQWKINVNMMNYLKKTLVK